MKMNYDDADVASVAAVVASKVLVVVPAAFVDVSVRNPFQLALQPLLWAMTQ